MLTFSGRLDHPVCSDAEASRHFSYVASTPPRGVGGLHHSQSFTDSYAIVTARFGELKNSLGVASEPPALGLIWSTATSAPEFLERSFQDGCYIDLRISGTGKHDAQLIGFIRHQSDRTGASTYFHGKQL